MVKVVVNDNKGLVQYGGQSGLTLDSAVTVNGAGVQAVKFSDELTIAVGQADYDTSVVLPANALIIDLGIVCTTQIDCAGASTVTVDFGTSAGGAELVVAKQINAAGTDVLAGAAQSVLLGNTATVAGTAFATIVPAQLLRNTAATTIHMRTTVGGADLTTAGAVRMFVRYVVIA